MDIELQHLVEVYRIESSENLATMEQGLLTLERSGSPDAELIRNVLRAAHTLKGNSATIGYDAVAAAAHLLEDQLEQLREGALTFSADLITRLLQAVDELRGLLRAAGPVANKATEKRAPAKDSTLRVAIGRLDTLLDLTAEITIARGRLMQLAATESANTGLAGTLDRLEQLHGSLQEEVMKLRMVPLGPTLRVHHRTVRDVARKQSKEVEVEIHGEDVEVDTSIAEHLRDPLTHMMRNAVDHGIESPAERRNAGKRAAGTIVLKAEHRGGSVVIEVSDDGRGLDRARIAAKAEALGLIADASALTEEQADALIFEAGFTTAAAVSDVSGRGVGMDIVRRQINALRGTVEVISAPGQGTRFVIRLPLTVAIIAGFRVSVGPDGYVLPLEAVEECLDFSGVHAQEQRGGEGVLNLRGGAVPFAWLRDLLGLAPAARSRRASVVIIRHGDARVGVVVDSLDGDCQAVIKPLAAVLNRPKGIAGSTILGDGRVALILDVPQLVELATRRARARSAA
ncbi:MAG TPA: chemotaxis protein CheA [Gemmatimonadales bacterium]|jgi:two-component system chemotaxis sensor kinase CheA|nr:chemotaxis protein CheA [Gemmatimonadales bacterium]